VSGRIRSARRRAAEDSLVHDWLKDVGQARDVASLPEGSGIVTVRAVDELNRVAAAVTQATSLPAAGFSLGVWATHRLPLAAGNLDPTLALPLRRLAQHVVDNDDDAAMLAVLLERVAEVHGGHRSARLARLLSRGSMLPGLAPILLGDDRIRRNGVLLSATPTLRPLAAEAETHPPASGDPSRQGKRRPATDVARRTKPRRPAAGTDSRSKQQLIDGSPAADPKAIPPEVDPPRKKKPRRSAAAPRGQAKQQREDAGQPGDTTPDSGDAAGSAETRSRSSRAATPRPRQPRRPDAASSAATKLRAPDALATSDAASPEFDTASRASKKPSARRKQSAAPSAVAPARTRPRLSKAEPPRHISSGPVEAAPRVRDNPPERRTHQVDPPQPPPQARRRVSTAALRRAPLDESLEAVPPRYRQSLAVRVGMRTLQLVCVLYAAGLLWWLWLAKELSVAAIFQDPLVYGYSIVITAYILGRFAIGSLYRPTPDLGYRPSVSIVIPVFNERDRIHETVEACFTARYPTDRLQVVAIDDGSTDGSWEQLLTLRHRFPSLLCIRFSKNRGKRAAMAEGVRHSSGAVCVFIDSDSVIEPAGIEAIVQDFTDERVGAVVGHAHVLNKADAWIPQMQQVRYFIAFRILKGSESMFGAVTCASGCLAAYRRSALDEVLSDWEAQMFLGRRATYGDDRALTNRVLRRWRIVYQSRAVCHTLVPTGLRLFMRQQLRWKKSWVRESLYLSAIIWRKHPFAAALTYASIVCSWVAPLIVLRALVHDPIQGDGDPALYAAGVYSIALLGCLYYAVAQRSPIWWQGLTWTAVYITLLVWQLYYAIATLRNTAWGTRRSTRVSVGDETIVIRPEAPAPRSGAGEPVAGPSDRPSPPVDRAALVSAGKTEGR
jgi:hyaluronan synthase